MYMLYGSLFTPSFKKPVNPYSRIIYKHLCEAFLFLRAEFCSKVVFFVLVDNTLVFAHCEDCTNKHDNCCLRRSEVYYA